MTGPCQHFYGWLKISFFLWAYRLFGDCATHFKLSTKNPLMMCFRTYYAYQCHSEYDQSSSSSLRAPFTASGKDRDFPRSNNRNYFTYVSVSAKVKHLSALNMFWKFSVHFGVWRCLFKFLVFKQAIVELFCCACRKPSAEKAIVLSALVSHH